MKRRLLEKVISIILIIALVIIPNTAITYAMEGQEEYIDFGIEGAGSATTESAIKASVQDEAEIDYDISWYSDDEDNFVIINAQQLRGLSHLVNGTAVSGTAISAKNFYGKTVTIGDEIDLKNEEWVPIGIMENGHAFSGDFDGKGHKISGISMENDSRFQGFFEYLEEATIKNLELEGSIEYTGEDSDSYSGGFAGYAWGSSFENVTNYISVSNAYGSAGGICSAIDETDINKCTNNGEITGGFFAGGITGILYTSASIDECENLGDVSGTVYIGGIAGFVENSSGVNINRCVSSGTVKADADSFDATTGGIFGFDSYRGGIRVTNCFIDADIEGADNGYTGAVAGKCTANNILSGCLYYNESPLSIAGINTLVSGDGNFYMSAAGIEGYKGRAVSKDSLKYGEATYLLNKASGSNEINWEQGDYHPVLSGDSPKRMNLFKIDTFALSDTSVEVNIVPPAGAEILESSGGAKSIYVTEGTVEFSFSGIGADEKLKLMVTPEEAVQENSGVYSVDMSSGDVKVIYGLESEYTGVDITWYDKNESIFEISSDLELYGLAMLVNGDTAYGSVSFENKIIKLSKVIILGEKWTSIGKEGSEFKGTFDGNNQTVNNLQIGSVTSPSALDYQGLFGYSSGQIKNLKVKGTVESSGDYVGGIAGYSGGSITNCTFGEEGKETQYYILGGNNVGGIAGWSNGPVYSSVNYGNVSGTGSYIGGIAGKAKNSIGSYSTNDGNKNYGEVTGEKDYVGGVVGNCEFYVRYSENYGKVTGNSSYVGGVAGYVSGETYGNKNSGDVKGASGYVGGISGYTGSTVSNNTNTAKIENSGDNYTGGISGYASGYSGLMNNENSGDVSSGGDYTGGLFGYATSSINSSKNKGNISGNKYTGGWAGYTEGSCQGEMGKLSSEGAAVTGTEYVGAIAGLGSYMNYISADGATTVSGTDNVGGIVGYLNGSSVQNSYSLADVTGSSLTGGIAGSGEAGTKVKNSFYYNENLSNLCGSGAVAIENSYSMANAEDTEKHQKNNASFSSGEVAWLLEWVNGARISTWTQKKEDSYPTLGNNPVYHVKLTEGTPIEGNSLETVDGTYGPAVSESAIGADGISRASWDTYVLSVDDLKVSAKLTEGRTLTITPPVNMRKEGDNSYLFKVSNNGDFIYNYGITVEPDYDWYLNNTSDEYLIKTEAELVGLANLVNGTDLVGSQQEGAVDFKDKTISLDDNIPMKSGNWTPIGRSLETSFKGTFNGNNKTIDGFMVSSLENNIGLFGYVSNAKIIDLTVSGSVYGTGWNTGGIVGASTGASYFKNLVFGSADDVISGGNNTGGIIGYIQNMADSEYTVVEDCINNAAISGDTSYNSTGMGGIAGGSDSLKLKVINCENNGDVTNVGRFTAGILGYYNVYGASDVLIERCVNNGSITGGNIWGVTVGGIASYINGNSSIEDCSNNGSIVNIGGNGTKIGGIVGEFQGKNLTGNYNTETVEGAESVGGIAGVFAGSKLSRCFNTGDITSPGQSIGGIVGKVEIYMRGSDFMVRYCYNTGNISGNQFVGGISGSNGVFSDWSSTETVTGVESSYNTGAVSVQSGKSGAISGQNYELDRGNASLSGSEHVDEKKVKYMTSEQFASGEASYYLDRGDRGSNRTLIWSTDGTMTVFADSGNRPVYKITIADAQGGNVESEAYRKTVYAKSGTPVTLKVTADSGKILKLLRAVNADTDEVVFSDSNKDSITFIIPDDNAADVRIEALFAKNVNPGPHSVKFISNEAEYDAKTVLNGEKVAEPAMPSRTGFEFLGWYTSGGEKWDFNTAVTEDIVLYAKWKTEGKIIVTFNTNGGEFKDGSKVISVEYDKDAVIIPPEEPTTDLLEFKGWFTSRTNNIKLTSNTKAEKDITYFAQWKQMGEFYPGTEEYPYVIKTFEELQSLADQVSAGDTFKDYYFQLAEGEYILDDWEGIGGGSYYFSGSFDGNDSTIIINGQSGLFGYIKDAVVKNINLEADISRSTAVGALANTANAETEDIVIKNISMSGTVSGISDVGGLIGYGYCEGWLDSAGRPYTVYIEGCQNDSDVNGSSDRAGGLVGRYDSHNHIKDSSNSGNIVGGNSTGGLVGTATYYGRFEGCFNTGNVTGKNNTGGLVGHISTHGGLYERASTIFDDCHNKGEITGESLVGGLMGGPIVSTEGSRTGKYTNYTNCYNMGKIIAAGNYVGGIAGNTVPDTKGESKHVYNTGEIKGADYVAGLFGHRTEKDIAENCYNMGTINATGENKGAISAVSAGTTTDCYSMASSIENPVDAEFLTILEQESFSNGHAAYLLDGGNTDGSSSDRRDKWSQDFAKGNPILKTGESVYMVTMSSKGNGSVEIKDKDFIEAEDDKSVYFEIEGKKVKINAVPEKISETEEYKLKNMLVTDLEGKEIYRFDENNNIGNTEHEFTMPGSNVTVTAEFELQEKVNITPQITGFSDGATMTIGNAENGAPYIANMGDTVNVSVNILSHPAVEGATSAEYYLKSIKVEFEDGSPTIDITDVRQFIATGNAVVTADIGEKTVFPPIEEPKEDDDDDDDSDDKEVIGGGTGNGNGTGDGTGSGTGEGTGGGTDTGQDGNQTGMPDTGTAAPVDNNTKNEDKNTTPAVNVSQQPKEKEETVAEAEPDEEIEAEEVETPPQPEEEEPEKPEEPEEEAEEASTTPSANEQRNMIPPIAAAVAAVLLILIGIYRFIILKKKK